MNGATRFDVPSPTGPGWRQPETAAYSYSNETIETSDAWHISIHRFVPVDRKMLIPVAILPGFGSTSWNFYGGARNGIVGALVTAGHEVWLLDGRGVGASIHAKGKGRPRIADRLAIDLPAFLDHVMDYTDSAHLDMIGHGLGGVLIYLHALLEPRTPIRRAVTIGAPLRLSEAALPQILRGWLAGRMVSLLGRIPLSRWTERLQGRERSRPVTQLFGDSEAHGPLIAAYMRSGIADIHGAELKDLMTWISIGDLRALAPVRDRYTGKRRLTFPVRFLVGSDDPITPPQSVFEAFDELGGKEKDFRVIGRAHGYSQDYRHLDILLGPQVNQEVAPLVVDWLRGEAE